MITQKHSEVLRKFRNKGISKFIWNNLRFQKILYISGNFLKNTYSMMSALRMKDAMFYINIIYITFSRNLFNFYSYYLVDDQRYGRINGPRLNLF